MMPEVGMHGAVIGACIGAAVVGLVNVGLLVWTLSRISAEAAMNRKSNDERHLANIQQHRENLTKFDKLFERSDFKQATLVSHGMRLDDHERRITTLEEPS